MTEDMRTFTQVTL